MTSATKKARITVVLPAYNAGKTLLDTYEKIVDQQVDEIILVDDAVTTTSSSKQRDGESSPSVIGTTWGTAGIRRPVIPSLCRDMPMLSSWFTRGWTVRPRVPGRYRAADSERGCRCRAQFQDVLSGSGPEGRNASDKYVSNISLTAIENFVLRRKLSEYHTGYRAYTRHFLETNPFMRNANDFVFDTQVLVQAVAFGMRIAEIPVTTRYFTEASSVDFKKSVVYALKTLGVLLRYVLHRLGILSSR
jgi:hypothetical protein